MMLLISQVRERINIEVFANIISIAFALFFLVIAGQIYLPLPFTPVPIVLSNSVAIMFGIYMPKYQGLWSLLIYLSLAALGFPVLAKGGTTLMDPTLGYLLGYLVSAFLLSWIRQKDLKPKNIWQDYLYMSFGNVIVYLCGAGYLGYLFGYDRSLAMGVLPFIIGDFLIKPSLLCGGFRLLKWARKYC
jgi:biotin transport system substrate-specific component